MLLKSNKSLVRSLLILTVLALLLGPTAAMAQGSGPWGEGLPRELRSQGVLQPDARTRELAYPVVANGLDNPRGLTFATGGRLLVAEAGEGGDACINPDPNDPTLTVCVGLTGAITSVDLRTGTSTRVVTGLPSHANPEGMEATGPHDVAKRGAMFYALTGLGADPALRSMYDGIFEKFGWLLRVAPGADYLVDVSAYEASNNPDGGVPDSNPYSLVSLGGKRFAVADAGANALLMVDAGTGAISTLAVFPARVVPVDPLLQQVLGLPPAMPAEAVPNSVAVGPDGALYVGQLLGFPFTPGQSNVYRVVPGQQPTVFASGFSSIIDIAFGPDGSLYVLEIAKGSLVAAFFGGDWTGALIKVDPQGNRTEVASTGLWAPGGVAINSVGQIYVTNNSIFPDIGQVLKVK